VRRLFEPNPKFEVCGEAVNGIEALKKAPSLRPDLIIIILDLSMPEMNGLEAAPSLIKILPQRVDRTLTAHEFPEVHRLLAEAGIHALVPKSKVSTDLVAQAELLVYPATGKAS
jgi:DNA-binding NarL/FixJ family response regulator